MFQHVIWQAMGCRTGCAEEKQGVWLDVVQILVFEAVAADAAVINSDVVV